MAAIEDYWQSSVGCCAMSDAPGFSVVREPMALSLWGLYKYMVASSWMSLLVF